MSERGGKVSVDESGVIHPRGPDAVRQLASRRGEFVLRPAPIDYIVMMRARGSSSDPDAQRVCRLSGEIVTPGALCDIVALIGYAKWRGELLLFDDVSSRSLFFDGDSIVSARSSDDSERLGQVLYRHGALDRKQVMAAAAATEDGRLRFGEAVVRLGFLGAEELFRLMEIQARQVFDAALRVSSGMFYFLEGFDETRLSFRLRTSVAAMLTDAVRRMDEMKYFRERIPSSDHVPSRVAGRLPPDGEPNRLYEAIDGSRSIAEIGRMVRAEEFEVTRALFELTQAGFVAIHAPRPRGPRAVVDVFNHAMRLVMRELDAMDVGDEVRRQLAEFAAEGGIYDVLFKDAGPADDGTLDGERIEENFARLSAPRDAEYLLAEWLHEYASYAMFLAKPHLSRAESGHAPPTARRPSAREKRRLSEQFRAVLSSIAPPPKNQKPG